MYHLAQYEGSTDIENALWKVDQDGDIKIMLKDMEIHLTKEDLERMLMAVKYEIEE